MPADNEAAAGQAGFTLIEVLVVVAIMGLALLIFATQGTTRHPAMDLGASTSALASSLRLARSQAIATDRPTVFLVDAGARTYHVDADPPRPLPPDLAVAVTTVAGAAAGRAAAIGFAADGSSTGGRIELGVGDHRATIDIDWLTGRVSVTDAR